MFERVGRGDVGFELALGEPGKELLDVFLVVPRLVLGERAPEDADDGAAFEQREVERDTGNVARREADDQEAAIPGDAAQGGFRVVATKRVDDHVNAVAAGKGLYAFSEVLVGVVDDVVCAVLFADLAGSHPV